MAKRLTGILFCVTLLGASVVFAQEKPQGIPHAPGDLPANTPVSVSTVSPGVRADTRGKEEPPKPARNPFAPRLPKRAEDAPVVTKIKDPQVSPQTNVPGAAQQVIPPPEPPQPPAMKMSGLVWNTDRPQAILNDQIVTVGDIIQNWKITQINQKGVTLVLGETSFTVDPP